MRLSDCFKRGSHVLYNESDFVVLSLYKNSHYQKFVVKGRKKFILFERKFAAFRNKSKIMISTCFPSFNSADIEWLLIGNNTIIAKFALVILKESIVFPALQLIQIQSINLFQSKSEASLFVKDNMLKWYIKFSGEFCNILLVCDAHFSITYIFCRNLCYKLGIWPNFNK